MSELIPNALHAELRALIAGSRQRLAGAVNAELTRLYWSVGERLRTEVLGGADRAKYGDQLINRVGDQLAQEFGRGFEAKNLRRMVQFAQAFPLPEIVATLSRQLSWSHFVNLLPLKTEPARQFYASQAAAIVNSTAATGTDQTRGKVQASVGTTGLKRLDACQDGKIDDCTFYAIGGFIRKDGGHRDNGFLNDRGGQIRANLKRVTDAGAWKLSANVLDGHNVFYLPLRVADPRNPGVFPDPYIDCFKEAMHSPSLRNVRQKYLDGANVLQSGQRDLAKGRHLRFGNVGLQYDDKPA